MKKIIFTVLVSTGGLMAGVWDWVKIIAELLGLIFANPGANIHSQLEVVAIKHDVAVCDIWNHGGFGYEDEMPDECRNNIAVGRASLTPSK